MFKYIINHRISQGLISTELEPIQKKWRWGTPLKKRIGNKLLSCNSNLPTSFPTIVYPCLDLNINL